MLWKCCIQYASKFAKKLSSGHRNAKGQFSFQSQRKVMPKKVQSTAQLHSSPRFMGFFRQEYWSGLPFPSPRDLPDPGIEPRSWIKAGSPSLQADALPCKPPGKPPQASKVILKIPQARLQQCVNCELPNVPAGFRKGRGTRDQIANICWVIVKAREFQRNISFCFIDYTKAFDCVDHKKLWKTLKEMGIPDYLPCLLRNLYTDQATTVRSGHGTGDFFHVVKWVRQDCILSPCSFNLFAE